ncbi:macrophage colony-stimulating factor 1 receptor-like [Anguilla rostrata]|uniref:macrophage colony-stimulating factor 1 receptor-like n=1 Tax=Anguilla rostrata TaxID=7938 RepID=UPI0030CE1D4D
MLTVALLLLVLQTAAQDPQSPFTLVRSVLPTIKEGSSCLLPCLLTDPAATEFSLRMKNGSSAPAGMNYTADPGKGILIHNLRPSYSGQYVCSAKIKGKEEVSKPFLIKVSQRLRHPPNVSLDKDEYVRLVGEELMITCTAHNPNLNYYVTWRSTGLILSPKETVVNDNGRWSTRSVLMIPAVNVSHAGNLTCSAGNEAGVNYSTARLQVVDQPYIWLSPGSSPGKNGTAIEVNEGKDLELRVWIEAYPEIEVNWWDTPKSHNHSMEFHQHNNRYEAALLLKRMQAGEQGQYVFHARSSKVKASIAFHVKMLQRPSAMLRLENASTLTCTSFGYPAPRISWYRCSGIRSTCDENETQGAEPLVEDAVLVWHEEYGSAAVMSVLTLPSCDHRTTVECVAFNSVGKNRNTFVMDVSQAWSSKIITPSLAGAAGVLLLLMIVLLYKYKQKPKYEIRWKIIEASDGNHYTFIDPSQLPYSEKWEFPRDQLKLGKVLGAGAFGKVVEATAYGLGKEENVLRVAVKMLKPTAHSEEREALMCELKILSHLGQHRNIVNLLGACTHGGPVLVITEYCSHGDLLNFLRRRAESFLNFTVNMTGALERSGDGRGDYSNLAIKKPYIRSDSGISCTCSDEYQDMKPARRLTASSQDPCGEEAEPDTWPLDINDLLGFSFQVAQGLEFLASKNCIHRDVAARNVLLTDSRIAKICDFGLARDIMNDSNYVVKGNARLPVKWMAPESIFDCIYTVQSDVWSYGILLWEIFSLGKSPYPGVPVDSRFYKMIKDGCQMCQPEFAPTDIYGIIKACWNLEPTERPTFSKIVQTMGHLLHDPSEQAYENVLIDVPDHQPESCHSCGSEEESCHQSCDREDEGQPLMNANNYQLC